MRKRLISQRLLSMQAWSLSTPALPLSHCMLRQQPSSCMAHDSASLSYRLLIVHPALCGSKDGWSAIHNYTWRTDQGLNNGQWSCSIEGLYIKVYWYKGMISILLDQIFDEQNSSYADLKWEMISFMSTLEGSEQSRSTIFTSVFGHVQVQIGKMNWAKLKSQNWSSSQSNLTPELPLSNT